MKNSLAFPIIETPVGRRAACTLLCAAGGVAAFATLAPACGAAAGSDAPDAGSASDGGAPVDVGKASSFQADSPVPEMDASGLPFYVVRDARGLYALTAVCTHRGCTVNVARGAGAGFVCPCHGSAFDENGVVTIGPAVSPLVHFSCVVSNGDLLVDTSRTVPPDARVAG